MNRKQKQVLEDEWGFWVATAMFVDRLRMEDKPAYVCSEVDRVKPVRLKRIIRARQMKNMPRHIRWVDCSWWPQDKQGNRHRRDFCWRMAERVEKEMNGG